MSKFWKNWLNVWCAGVALFGLVLAGGAFEATSGPARALFALLMDGPEDVSPQSLGVGAQMRLALDPHLSFTLGVLGAATIGWAATLAFMFRTALALERYDAAAAQRVWTLMLAFFLVWYVGDGAISIATGFWKNIILNTLLVAGLVAPLAANGTMRARLLTRRAI